MRELILFIAYKACFGKDVLIGRNPFQFRNATILISVFIQIHILQIILLVNSNWLVRGKQISIGIYFVCAMMFFLISYLTSLYFSRKVLARAIKMYKDSKVSHFSKLIVLVYFIVNVAIVFALIKLQLPL